MEIEDELNIFRNELRKIYYIYDDDNSGVLEPHKVKKQVNDLRESMYQPKCGIILRN